MKLLVDIGNTALKAAWVENSVFGKTYRYQGEKGADFIVSLTEGQRPDLLVISSVKAITGSARTKLEQCAVKTIILDPASRELREKWGLPAWLSSDRCASIIAAREMFRGRSCTIIDLGNTITTDFISESGEYLGGNITLGLVSRYKGLNRYAKNMPFLPLTDEDPEKFSLDFENSIHSGIVGGISAEISSQIEIFPKNAVIITGADANYFVKRLKNSIFAVSNLVLLGLAQITIDENE